MDRSVPTYLSSPPVEAVADGLLVTVPGRLVVASPDQLIGKILLVHDAMLVVVRIAISVAVALFSHEGR